MQTDQRQAEGWSVSQGRRLTVPSGVACDALCCAVQVDVSEVMGTGLFDMERASKAAGWVQVPPTTLLPHSVSRSRSQPASSRSLA